MRVALRKRSFGELIGLCFSLAAGNFGLEVTLPGPSVVPMAGVTWVSVATTHRRRGIAGRLMHALHESESSPS